MKTYGFIKYFKTITRIMKTHSFYNSVKLTRCVSFILTLISLIISLN